MLKAVQERIFTAISNGELPVVIKLVVDEARMLLTVMCCFVGRGRWQVLEHGGSNDDAAALEAVAAFAATESLIEEVAHNLKYGRLSK